MIEFDNKSNCMFVTVLLVVCQMEAASNYKCIDTISEAY